MHHIFYQTPAGILQVSLADGRMSEAVFIEQAPVSAQVQPVSLCTVEQFSLQGTGFQVQVWQAALKIPAGTTVTYQELAEKIGRPKAHRAVANALGKNKIAYFIPCHRVVQKTGALGGYKWGIARKDLLLQAENSL